ncbi:MAG: GH36-type glycosyl hydrolase domain-containing protein [Oceanipulchritudo sp.]
MKSYVTPDLKGDICTDFHHYLTNPQVTEELHRNSSGRNFWLHAEGFDPWSVCGASVFQKGELWSQERAESSEMEASPGWFRLRRRDPRRGIEAETTLIVPEGSDPVELMRVTVRNTGEEPLRLTPFAALPLYGRSADHFRDHRQVTTMCGLIRREKHGVHLRPKIHHDETGHSENHTLYSILGFSADGSAPTDVWPLMHDFIGEGGSLENPRAVWENAKAPDYEPADLHGQEAIGAMRFAAVELQPGAEAGWVVVCGITDGSGETASWGRKFGSAAAFEEHFSRTHDYWQRIVSSVDFKTGDLDFDNWMKWLTFQLKCRQIFGNSYLPDYGYGRGGRGWRDLWQDLLSIFLVDPESAREEIINNHLGIRVDGSNATIIGTRPGEFKADRNNIPRTWCDHGAWPFYVVDFYLNQTGDYEVLLKEATYWKDDFTHRSKQRDSQWDPQQGHRQLTASGAVYSGSLLEHALIQNLSAYFHVGEHNNLLLEGADWNDTIDMARERGESVTFHSYYANNFLLLADALEQLQARGIESVQVFPEMLPLLDRLPGQIPVDYADPRAKQRRLQAFFESVRHSVGDEKASIAIPDLVADLRTKADAAIQHIRENEWIRTSDGKGFFNGHYDNDGRRVHGEHPLGIRIDLVAQVIPTMCNTAADSQLPQMYAAVRDYLHEPRRGGLRVTSDYHEVLMNYGRITGYAYGFKEHGSKWMQQNAMLMFGLYQRGLAAEAYEVYRDIRSLCMDSGTTRTFPCIPSFIDRTERGSYTYLTASATWLLLAVFTRMFGILGLHGDLCIQPRLYGEQFDEKASTALSFPFRNRRLQVRIENPHRLDYGQFQIEGAELDGAKFAPGGDKLVIPSHRIDALDPAETHTIRIILGKRGRTSISHG